MHAGDRQDILEASDGKGWVGRTAEHRDCAEVFQNGHYAAMHVYSEFCALAQVPSSVLFMSILSCISGRGDVQPACFLLPPAS